MDRTTFIGGSDAVRLVNGDWENLYLEKIGEKQPDNLSDNLQVQIGIATEQLNVEWFVKNHSNNLDMNMIERNTRLGVYMIDHVPCAANLDGLITQHQDKREWILECKHTNPFTSIKDVIERYMPQVQFYMHLHRHRMKMIPIRNRYNCCGAFISIIQGNGSKYHQSHIEYNDLYAEKIMELVKKFWLNHVVPKIKPTNDGIEDPPEVNSIPIDRKVQRCMSSSNEFTNDTHDYIKTMEVAHKHEEAKKRLLSHVTDDVYEMFNDYLVISVSKTGRRTIKLRKAIQLAYDIMSGEKK